MAKFLNKIFHKISIKFLNVILPKLKEELREVVREELMSKSHDIKYAMQQIAAKESANFILNNVPKNLDFKDRFELLTRSCDLIKESNNDKEGIILEFGVWKGSTINHMSKQLPQIKFYGFDSFEGLTEPWIYNDPGAFGNLNSLPTVNDNVTLVKGFFNETLPSFVDSIEDEVRLIHIDCDLYSSTVTIFEYLKNYIKPGIIIVFDEFFNYPGWQHGEFKAWNELLAQHNINYNYVGYTFQKTKEFRSGQQIAVQII